MCEQCNGCEYQHLYDDVDCNGKEFTAQIFAEMCDCCSRKYPDLYEKEDEVKKSCSNCKFFLIKLDDCGCDDPCLELESWEPIEKDAHDPVNHPSHYTSHPSGVEVIEITKHEDFCVGNALKYILRHKHKENPVQDLKKAVWYLEMKIKMMEEK